MKNENIVVSFSVSKNFKTFLVRSDIIDIGEYSLYKNSDELVNGIYIIDNYTKGNKVTVNDSDIFSVSKTINVMEKVKVKVILNEKNDTKYNIYYTYYFSWCYNVFYNELC